MSIYKSTSGRKTSFTKSRQYSLFGLLIGLAFPLASTLLSFRESSAGFSLNAVAELHFTDPLLQIIDLAPIILFFAGLILGLKTDQLEKLLNSSEGQFKKLIEDAVEVIYTTDFKGNFIFINQSIQRVYGYSPEELIGKHFTHLLEPSMAKKVAGFYLNQFEQKIPETISDLQIIDKSGNVRWVEQTVILKMNGKMVEGFQSVVRDIDNRVKQNQEIDKLNGELKSKVLELESVNQELGAFNYTVSHDLRSPLRGISTLVEILQTEYDNQLPDEAQELLSRIIVNSDKIQQLVEDLLEFSKIAKQEIKKEEVNIREVTEQILTELISNESEDKTSVQIDNLANAVCDKHLIKQVLVNFISNAFKYSSKKENPLIRIGNYFKNNEQVYFVKDNGAGFDMAYYKKLFGVFSRLHTDSEFKGTGVGLSIARRIIERHGGKVWAEGQQGVGATFYFSIPVNSNLKNSESIKINNPIFYS